MGAGGDQDLAHQLKRDWRKADLSDKHKTMLAFCEKLTVNPSGVSKDDMQTVRDAGWSERDYYDMVLLTAAFNFITRVADAFGVQVDDMMKGMLDAIGEELVFAAK